MILIDQAVEVRAHQSLRASPEEFLQLIAPYRQDIVVAVECMFAWYWLADFCEREGIPFVLGHALYMKALHMRRRADRFDNPFVRKSIEADLAVRPQCPTAHLKWAFPEAAVLSLRQNPKALSILAHKLGRTVYYLLLRDEAFDMHMDKPEPASHLMWRDHVSQPRPRSRQPARLDWMAISLRLKTYAEESRRESA